MELPETLARYFSIEFFRHFSPGKLHIEWESTFPQLSPARQELEERFWAAFQEETASGTLFNGTLCQLRDYSVSDSGIRLTLGPVSFKSHIFSWMKGRALTESLAGGPQLGLGVSAVIVSADQRILFIKRSQKVAAAPGKFDVFGGHIDPERHRSSSRQVPDPFVAIRNEMTEELGTPEESLASLQGLGLVRNRYNTQPELVFQCEIEQPAEALLKGALRAADRGEYSHIIHIPNSPERLESVLLRYAEDFSPSGLGALWLHLQSLKQSQEQKPA